MSVLIVATHPVPLLMLVCALLLDVTRGTFAKGRSGFEWDALGMFAFVALLCVYPLIIGGGMHGGAGVQDYGFHLKRIARQLLLFGLSPYAAGSRAVLPNLYRLALYAVAAMAIYLGWIAWKQARRTSSLGFVNLLLPAGLLLGASILVLPDGVSGSFFFATRLISFVWIALLLSACQVEFGSESLRRGWLVATGSMFAVTVLAALVLIRPVAKQIAALGAEAVPVAGAGLVVDPSQDLKMKARGSLQFTPYHWAGAIPLTEAHQLMLNSPWLEQAILPLAFRNGSPLLNAQVTPGDVAGIALHDGTVRWLAPQSLQAVLRNTSVIFLRTPFPGVRLSDQIGMANASQFSCTSKSWYLRCVRSAMKK